MTATSKLAFMVRAVLISASMWAAAGCDGNVQTEAGGTGGTAGQGGIGGTAGQGGIGGTAGQGGIGGIAGQGGTGGTCDMTQCGPDCVDVQTDPAHCGACNMACA